jgi:hypothetical protein
LLNGIRADIHQQICWAKNEIRRETRHTVVTGLLAVMATFAALGSIIVALIAIYLWLTPQMGPFTALGDIGSGLLLLALMLFVSAIVWRRPQFASRPPLQITGYAVLLGTCRQGGGGKITRSDERVATEMRRSRSALFGTLVVAGPWA